MPKYKPHIAKARAKKLLKTYKRNGLNQTKLALQEGVSQSAISQRLQKAPVKKLFSDILDKAGVTDNRLAKSIREGISATKVISAFVIVKPNEDGSPNLDVKNIPADEKSTDFIDVPDHPARHRFVVTALEAKAHIRQNLNQPTFSIVNINYGYRNRPDIIPVRGEPADTEN